MGSTGNAGDCREAEKEDALLKKRRRHPDGKKNAVRESPPLFVTWVTVSAMR